MLNMESASVGASMAGLSKSLTTPFSINDILTRSSPDTRRVSSVDSDPEPEKNGASMKSSDRDRSASKSPPLCCRDLSLYKLAQAKEMPPNPSQRQATNYLQYYAAAMDNNNHHQATATATNSSAADYMQRKLAYFGSTLAAPLDMRRCTSNDSGGLFKNFAPFSGFNGSQSIESFVVPFPGVTVIVRTFILIFHKAFA